MAGSGGGSGLGLRGKVEGDAAMAMRAVAGQEEG